MITTITILLIKYNQRNSFDYQRNKGIAYEEKKEYEKAEKYFEQALKLEKENLEVKHRLVEIYLSLEERDSAIDMLKDIISLDSSDMDAMQKLIELYAAVEEYDEIQKLYIKTKDSNAQKLFEGYAVSTPVFETDPGTYKKKIMLTLSCQENCKIYYTQDGSNPVKNGIEYTKEIELTEGSVTIRAVSCNQHDIYSEEIEGTYTIAFQAPETPKVIPDSGKFNIPQNITVEVPKGCRVYYTWDGSIPTVNNAQYTEPIEVPEGNNILSLIVINEHDLCSNILKCNYIYIPE
ncbi:MAG: chitobiase/beta-hexosaminidase C-terminal domain-containing protein [Lachnospiraceae bacterium]